MSMATTGNAYFHASTRVQRTLLTIVFLYVLLNGSGINLLNGLAWITVIIVANADGFWRSIMLGTLFIMILVLAVYMARRWKLARSNTNIPLLALQTLAVFGGLVITVLVAGKVLTGGGWFTPETYWEIFQWTWQIPLGYFVGTGLSWAVVDRKISGIITTREAPPVDSDVDPIDHEHHDHTEDHRR